MSSFDLTPQEVQVIAALRACATAHFDLMLSGETPQPPPSPPKRGAAQTPQAIPLQAISFATSASEGEVPSCPNCGGEMWDNRETKQNPRAPDFKCKNKACLDDNGYTTGLYQKKPPAKKAPAAVKPEPPASAPTSAGAQTPAHTEAATTAQAARHRGPSTNLLPLPDTLPSAHAQPTARDTPPRQSRGSFKRTAVVPRPVGISRPVAPEPPRTDSSLLKAKNAKPQAQTTLPQTPTPKTQNSKLKTEDSKPKTPMQRLAERCTEAGLCCDREGHAVVPHILNVLKFENFTSDITDSTSITPDNWQPAFNCVQRHYQQKEFEL